jgi:iron complex transport system substrate-binding protein
VAEPRIVSLIASATEIVAALGLGRFLVGRSHECDYPPEVLALPACSEPKIDVHATSRQIDARVKSLAGDAISVYRVFPDLLRQLEPTHIITQTQCEVCAVSLRDVEEAMAQLIGQHPKIVALAPMCLDDVWNDIRIVGRSLEVAERADDLVQRLRGELDGLSGRVAQSSCRPSSCRPSSCRPSSCRPSIACLEWIDPLMSAGNWVPELVEIAGGRNLLGTAGKHSPWLAWDELVACDGDVIAVMPCGFDIARTRAEMTPLTQDARWQTLRAVREGRVFLTDGNQFFNRPGPRVVESARILAAILHPDLGDNSLEGAGWVKFDTRPVVDDAALP